MIASQRQEAVYKEWTEGNSNMLIQSVAGSGKTTTLMGLLERSEWRTLFLAFNKSIQTEIETIIAEKGLNHAKALTLHSLGLASIRQKHTVVINNNKKWSIVNEFKKFHKSDLRRMSFKEQSYILFTLIDMLEVKRIYVCETFESVIASMRDMGKPVDTEKNSEIEEYFESFYNIYCDMTLLKPGSKIEIDFVDMIYLPVVVKDIEINIRPYYLFVDECQDLNLAQHKFINKLISQGDVNRWVAVGDSNQSIYGFSGSYSKSFDLFKEKENVKTFPLDVCYRSSKKIVDEANKVYDIMQSFKEDDGIVENIIDVDKIKDSSMVVCRNTAPILKLYFNLLSKERKAYIKGSDILNPTISYLKKFKVKNLDFMLRQTRKDLSEVAEKKNDSQRIKFHILNQHLENISILILNIKLNSSKVSELIEKLQDLSKQAEEPESIELSTIHKSKGRENDVVYILNENLIPSPFAFTEDQLIQEQNLKYVARTRAKKELYYLNLK